MIQILKIIAMIGPPHSGKSVLVYMLDNYIKSKIGVELYHKYFYIIRACPDGEGNWSMETPPEITKTIRYKNKFDDNFIESVCTQIENLKKEKKIILVDCGGRIDRKNQRIFNLCSDSIIVSNNVKQVDEWIGASKSCDLNILSVIHSKVFNVSKVINADNLEIELGFLDRNNNNLPQLPDILINKICEKLL